MAVCDHQTKGGHRGVTHWLWTLQVEVTSGQVTFNYAVHLKQQFTQSTF